MNLRRAVAMQAAITLSFGGVLVLAGPAQAAVATETVCSTWTARGATGAYPDVDFGGKPDGTEITEDSAKLVKPVEGVQPGVEFATKNLDLDFDAATTVTVKFKLNGDASASAGAVRLFGYKAKDADTLNDGPDFQDVATTDEGTLTLNVTAGTLGTLGLVFDASNDSKGSVTFTDMKVGDRPVSFTTCPEPEPEKKDCEAYLFFDTQENLCGDFAEATEVTCAQVKFKVKLVDAKVDPWGLDNEGVVGVGCEDNPVKGEPTNEPTAPTTEPIPGDDGGGDGPGGGATLPVTGPGLPVAAFSIGLALVLIGGGALLVSRRRNKFTA